MVLFAVVVKRGFAVYAIIVSHWEKMMRMHFTIDKSPESHNPAGAIVHFVCCSSTSSCIQSEPFDRVDDPPWPEAFHKVLLELSVFV